MTDQTGTVVWSAGYAPFGKATVEVESVVNNLRFPGQYYDEETGLHYNLNRYYDPQTGRYMTPDPIGLDGGINLYAYVGGNPVNFTDPSGLCVWDACVGEAAYLSLAAGTAAAAWLASPQGQEALTNTLGWMMNENTSADQRQREYDLYKDKINESPPPDLDECALLRWKLQQAKDVRDMRQAWDDKWQPGRHTKDIADWDRRVKKLEKEIQKKCGGCP